MRRSVRATAVALVLGTSLALAGCSVAGPNTAAVVNGTRITEQDVDIAVRQVNEAFRPQTPFTPDKALTALIWAPEILDFAAANGFPQSESAARAMISLPDPAPSTVLLVRSSNALGHLTQEHQVELSERLKGLHVKVNPKFGTFDNSQAMIVPDQPDWLTTSGR